MRPKMKIAFVLPGCGKSGGVRVTVIAANHLIARGHAVRILYRKAPLTIRNTARAIAMKMIYLDQGWLEEFNGITNTFKEITDCSFDSDEIIVGVGVWSSGQLARLEETTNPKIQYIHGATPWEPVLMEKALPLPFPKIVVASHLKPLVESYGGGPVTAVIYNGIDQKEYFSSVDESERLGIGTIYSSHPAKDPQTVLDVIEQLSAVRPDVPIRIFGSHRRSRQIKKSSYCRYPSLRKAREIYSKSSVWIMASKSEGFPAPVLEAMACGCAVVATDCGGTRDMIKNGENGFLVDVGDVKQIVSKVLLLLDDEKLRERFRANAKKTVDKFTWDKSIDQLENTLQAME
jgi:glycosyltransferase involved in cell wall biosynthesis